MTEREQMCGDKIRHEEKYHAEVHAQWMFEKNRCKGKSKQTSEFNVYQCKFCEHWHIGHKIKAFFK